MLKQLCQLIFTLALLASLAGAEEATDKTPLPQKYELQLISILDGQSPEYIFVLGGVGFKTVESLKKFLAGRPRGTELQWAPGCVRLGDEPLLSSEKDMKNFEEFLKEHGIKFTLVPSG